MEGEKACLLSLAFSWRTAWEEGEGEEREKNPALNTKGAEKHSLANRVGERGGEATSLLCSPWAQGIGKGKEKREGECHRKTEAWRGWRR